MAITAAVAQSHLDKWLAADLAVSEGRSYSIGDRTLTRESAREIREGITYWTRQVEVANAVAAGSNSPAALACWNICE